jgi:3-methylfumaryl-CoA hydratase
VQVARILTSVIWSPAFAAALGWATLRSPIVEASQGPDELDIADLGIEEHSEVGISSGQAGRLAATLDMPAPAPGAPLPLLWHWAFFTPTTPTTGLGPDGHPKLPPGGKTAGYPRRMWVGGRVRSDSVLVVDQIATRRSRVSSWRETSGRSGSLLIVTIEHVYSQAGRVAVVEEQDLAYRSAGPELSLPSGDHLEEAPPGGVRRVMIADPPLLFRFSAATFNSHRIHYDEPYARRSEGYPTTVVHGPLTAMLLAGLASQVGGAPVTGLDFRAEAPLFQGLPFTLVAGPDGDGITGRAVRNDGVTAMTATATVGD